MKIGSEIKRIIDGNEEELNRIKSENSMKLKKNKFSELRKALDENPVILREKWFDEDIIS